MAKAGAKTGIRGPGISHGICLAVFPDMDPDPHVEIHRTTAANGSTAGGVGYEVIGVVDVKTGDRVLQYRDPLSPSTVRYHYRARSVRPEYTASTWTNITWGVPSELPPGDLPMPKARVRTIATGAQVGGVNALLDFGAASYNEACRYTNTTAWISGSTQIREDNTITVPFSAVYRLHAEGAYSSGAKDGYASNTIELNIIQNPTSNAGGGFDGTKLAYWRVPYLGFTSEGPWSIDTVQHLNGWDRISMYRLVAAIGGGNPTIQVDTLRFEATCLWGK